MRVLLVNDYPPGSGFGAEVHLAQLLDGLRAAGDTVEVFAGTAHRGISRVLDVWNPPARQALRKLEETFRPDVVHYHNVLRELSPSVFNAPNAAARVLTIIEYRLLGVPDGPIGRPVDPRPVRAVKHLAARAARSVARRAMDAFIVPNSFLAEWLRSLGFHEVHVVGHFSRADREPATLPSSSADVFFAGRVAPDKGVDLLIEAFARIADTQRDARLIIAGDGPNRLRWEREAKARLGERVVFLGQVGNEAVKRQMVSTRLVAVPSLMMEGGPVVAVEAALAGRPLVASDAPGLRELEGLDSFGIVVPRGNVEALARALERLLSDPAEADLLGAEARRIALSKWTIEAGVAGTHAVYERALQRSRARLSR